MEPEEPEEFKVEEREPSIPRIEVPPEEMPSKQRKPTQEPKAKEPVEPGKKLSVLDKVGPEG